jgi:hypothetical protein
MQQLAFSQTLTASDYMLIALVKLARWCWRPPVVFAAVEFFRRCSSASR